MNSINIEIERMKKKFFTQRLQNEMDTLEETTPRYEHLKKIYDEITLTNTELGTVLDAATNNVFTKKWNRLPNFHKLQKINEYLDEKYKNDPKRKDIEKTLTDKMNDGKLNSCKFVEYDNIVKFKIIKITLSKNETY